MEMNAFVASSSDDHEMSLSSGTKTGGGIEGRGASGADTV
jgi:hypothetical protein